MLSNEEQSPTLWQPSVLNAVGAEPLLHVPVACPVSDCDFPYSPLELAQHVIAHHLPSTESQLRIAYHEERSVLLFNPHKLQYGQSYCLGMLLYGGQRGAPEMLPARRGICSASSMPAALTADYGQHLPVMVLVRQCPFLSWLQPKELQLLLRDNQQPPPPSTWLIWTLSSVLLRPLYVTLTAYNQAMTEARGGLRRVRPAESALSIMWHSLNADVQLPREEHCIWLTERDLQQLYDAESKCICLELILHETPTLQVAQPNSS